MSKAIGGVKNFFLGATQGTTYRESQDGKAIQKNLKKYISKVQFARLRNDIQTWREAISEAEQAWYPHRVRMQRIYQDTILNEHIDACMRRRKRLTLLRDFSFVTENGKENDEVKKLFKARWFNDFQSYAHDALMFGYSLISLGDVINDSFPDLSIVPRQNVSPDRLNVTSYVYAIGGENFMEDPYRKWHVWVPTPSELGVSKCGYGMLYKIAKTEIYLRNTTESNVDGIEVFGQPIRVGKTVKTEEAERADFENALRNMGSMPYILLDDSQDTLELIESKNTGTGYKIYGDFEERSHKKISKVLLGHSDAMDSTPGKLGGGQDGEESPVQTALDEIQVEDGSFMENIINNQLLPRLREMGFQIPIEVSFKYSNNKEKEQAREKEDKSNKQTAEIAQTMASGGLKMDPKYFEERTGIPTTEAPKVAAPIPPTDPKHSEKVSNKLRKIYSSKHV